jgi:hypothetical protein
MKKTLLMSILLIPLMLIAAPIGYGGNPLPPLLPGSEYGNCIGPDVTGTIIVEKLEAGGINVTFNGKCKKYPVTGSILNWGIPFESITPQSLLGTCGECTAIVGCVGPQELIIAVPPDCYPNNKDVNEYPVVYKVIHFIESENTKIIDIVGRWPVIIRAK